MVKDIGKKLDEIRKGQREMLRLQRRLLKGEEEMEQEEMDVSSAEKEELDELMKLEKLEETIEKDVRAKPLARITRNDFSRAIIGAFFGVVGHFAFFYGTEIAEAQHFTMGRATALYAVSLGLAVLFLYFTGFRKVDKRSLRYMPVRVTVVYVTSLVVIVFVLFIFGFIDFTTHFPHVYKSVSAISLLAVLGASTADLIGREQ